MALKSVESGLCIVQSFLNISNYSSIILLQNFLIIRNSCLLP